MTENMTKHHEWTWHYLNKFSSKENPINKESLMVAMKMHDPSFKVMRQLRLVIEDLILIYSKPIGSSERGWFVIKNQLELNESVDYLEKKAMALHKRAGQLKKNAQAVTQGALL